MEPFTDAAPAPAPVMPTLKTFSPVTASTAYGVEKDRWNVVSFAPVTTTAVRLEITAQPGVSSGVIEWKIR